MKILVTGGAGLIGHNVVSKLEKLGHDLTIIDTVTNYGIIPQDEMNYLFNERKLKFNSKVNKIDISDPIGTKFLFNKHNFDIVIHLASFPRQKVVNSNPCLGSRSMSEGLLNLLELSIHTGVKRFIYTSSSMVYGDFNDFVTEESVCNPQGQYGILKLAGEWLIKDYQRKGLNYTIFRPSAVYGPLDVEDRVISKFLLTAMRGGVLNINGANEKLDFTYVDDVADGIVQSISTDVTLNKTYNITKSHSKSLLEAAQLAIKLVGKGSINIKEKDVDFPSRGALDITAARRDFGFNPKVDIDEGFEIYHNWLSTSEFWRDKI